MKVRSLVTGDVRDVSEASEHYYIFESPINRVEALSKENWVEVPTETWRDVTAECVVLTSGDIVRVRDGETYGINEPHYRLRKVIRPDGAYFVVEKKES